MNAVTKESPRSKDAATIATLRDELRTAHVTLSQLAALAQAIVREADARTSDGSPGVCFAGLEEIAQLAGAAQFIAEHGANVADLALGQMT